MLIRYGRILLAYGAGILCWYVIFGFLKLNCIYNVQFNVDSLWVTKIHEGLVKNVIGDVAYRSSPADGGRQCDDAILYVVRYYPNIGDDENVESRSLSSMVDAQSWRKIESDSTTVTYIDIKHKYVLHRNSDGAHISVYDK